jgi:hypothetical protein
MTFDLLSSVILTASATVVVATFVALFGSSLTQRILIGTGMGLWFLGVLFAGSSGTISTLQLGAGVLIPIALMSVIGFGSANARARLEIAPLPALIAPHTLRILGVLFVLLYAAKRLPAPFAPLAGWGDIFIGVTALPMAFLAARDWDRGRAAILIWNTLGLADLVLAVGLGAASAPGPIRLFFDEPSSAIMGSLPWILIPCFLVPALSFVHLVVFYQVLRVAQAGKVVPATV